MHRSPAPDRAAWTHDLCREGEGTFTALWTHCVVLNAFDDFCKMSI